MFDYMRCGGLGAMYTSTACGSKATPKHQLISVDSFHCVLFFEGLILLFIDSKMMSFFKKCYFSLHRCYLVSLMKRQTTNQRFVFSSDSWYLDGYEPEQDGKKITFVFLLFVSRTKISILLL